MWQKEIFQEDCEPSLSKNALAYFFVLFKERNLNLSFVYTCDHGVYTVAVAYCSNEKYMNFQIEIVSLSDLSLCDLWPLFNVCKEIG